MGTEVATEVSETIMIGDKVYDKDSVTPSVYFDHVKGLKNNVDYNEYDAIIDTTLKMLKKSKVTGQTEMAKELTHQMELAIKEVAAAKDGFDIFIFRKDVEKYIDAVEAKSVKVIELEKYEREIPDEIIDKLELAKKHFDQVYIIFTDYTGKETKKVAKHRRDKDPIMLGAFKNSYESHIYIEDRMFFIADWTEDRCELTLEEMCRDVKDKTGKDITYRISNPEGEIEVKNMLKSLTMTYDEIAEDSDKDGDEAVIKPVSLFEKIKRKATRKKSTSSSKSTGRGRKKKTSEETS